MNKEELLEELKTFPKEFHPDQEKQKIVLQNILKTYDHHEKKTRKLSLYNKWSTAIVGVAAVLLACFLFLPNMLNQGHEKEQMSQQPKKQEKLQKETTASSEKFYPKKLTNVKEIMISDDKGIRIKTIQNKEDRDSILDNFRQAVLITKLDKERENSITGQTYTVEFLLNNNDLITLQYWPNERNSNILDIQTRSWWKVDGLDQIIKDIVPPKFLTYEQVLTIAKTVNPNADWETNEFSINLVDKGSIQTNTDQVWLATGITPTGEKLSLYIDPVTGDVLKEEKPESTADAEKAVQSFFDLVSAGNYQAAWNLIHSRSKSPNPGADERQIKKQFDEYFKVHQPKLKIIKSSTWKPMWKVADCMCTLENTILIKASLDDGTEVSLHAIKEENDEWKLFWSSEGRLK